MRIAVSSIGGGVRAPLVVFWVQVLGIGGSFALVVCGPCLVVLCRDDRSFQGCPDIKVLLPGDDLSYVAVRVPSFVVLQVGCRYVHVDF